MDEATEFGFKRAALSMGIDPYDLLAKKAALDIVDNSLEELRLYSRVGLILLEKAGAAGSVQHRVLEKCANYDNLLSNYTYDLYVKPVKDYMCKLAGMKAGMKAMGALASLAALSPSVLLALAAGAGGLGGAGIYAMLRAIALEDAETQAKFELAKIYRDQANKLAEKASKGSSKQKSNPGFIF